MSTSAIGSAGSNAAATASQATQTIVQKQAEANAEISAGGLNDGDENGASGKLVNQYA